MFPLWSKQDWQLPDFLPLLHGARLQGCAGVPSLPSLVMDLTPEAQFSLFFGLLPKETPASLSLSL